MTQGTRISLMNRHSLSWLVKLVLVMTVSLMTLTLSGCTEHFTGLLNPKGLIALDQRRLFFDTLALMLIVVLPVIIMSITFVYHYQVSHRTRDYKPNWSHNIYLEILWWGIPCVIILILATMTWKKTHELDPYHPIAGHEEKPLLIQAIALPWKWLFVYPEQNVASLNYLEIPIGKQVEYWITADNVPMSAFFIPQLGSQIYAMAGMRTRLHLVATETGVYEGKNTQYNGDGFPWMNFEAHVVTGQEFEQWVAQVKRASNPLDDKAYQELVKPSMADKPKLFSSATKDLFDNTIMAYMSDAGSLHPRQNTMKSHKE